MAPSNNGVKHMPPSKQRKEDPKVRKLMRESVELLKQVDESYIYKHKVKRQYPTFERSEVVSGSLLGVGGFGIVYEVKAFDIEGKGKAQETEEKAATSAVAEMAFSEHGSNETKNTVATTSDGTDPMSNSDGAFLTEKSKQEAIQELENLVGTPSSQQVDDSQQHYDVATARKHMATHVFRKGDARYAIKRLHRELSELNRTRGMIDLAIEAKYLSVIWHPNIVKMRGMATGDILSPNFFIIMDRLYETLNIRISDWRRIAAENKGGWFGYGADKEQLEQLLVDRLTVAYDIAAALWYMHENKIVYRDIKQENIGFDIRGDAKVFDFGLCKSLSPELKADGVYGYRLTPRTGSIPYMAPEVADCKPYDEKCDVFSFAVLLWEMLSLKQAFKGYSRKMYLNKVAKQGERLLVSRSWPALTRLIIKESWDPNPRKRPDMKRVAGIIRGDLNERTSDPRIQQRTNHMRERSFHSFRLSRGVLDPEILSEEMAVSRFRESIEHGLEEHGLEE